MAHDSGGWLLCPGGRGGSRGCRRDQQFVDVGVVGVVAEELDEVVVVPWNLSFSAY
jgi:hypothetical protein